MNKCKSEGLTVSAVVMRSRSTGQELKEMRYINLNRAKVLKTLISAKV